MTATILNIPNFLAFSSITPDAIDYALLPEVPGGTCGCHKALRFYVAISKELNERVLEDRTGRLTPYVFKIGSTKICRDRSKSLNEFRQKVDGPGPAIFKEPAYAGATDWKILRCWQVESDRYDDRVFKKWLSSTYDPQEIRALGRCRVPTVEGVDTEKRFDDLCIMSEQFVRDRVRVRTNHPLHDEMLYVVAETLVMLGTDFIGTL